MSSLQKNVAGQNIGFQINSATTGAGVTVGVSGNVVIDGGAQAACAGIFTGKGGGQWNYAPTQAETNGTEVSFQFNASGAVSVGLTFYTIGYNPTLANLPANVTQFLGSASVGAAGYAGIDWGQVVNKTTTNALTNTTISTTQIIASVTGNVAGNVTGSVGSISGVSFPTNFGLLSITAAGLVSLTSNIKQNTTVNGFMFVMTDSTTHAPKPGLGAGVTPLRAIDGGSFSATTNAVTEIANGVYTINLSAADTNGAKIMLNFQATGADALNIEIVTQP